MNEDHQHHRPPGPLRKRSIVRTFVGALIGTSMFAATATLHADDLAGPELGGGFAQTARIVQEGDFNMAAVDQRGLDQFATLSQAGAGNRLEVWQGDGYGNHVQATQHGHDNYALLSQSGSGHTITLEQRGDGNLANIAQYGDGRMAFIEQFGNNNRLELVQGSSSPHVSLRQQGDGNVASLIQY